MMTTVLSDRGASSLWILSLTAASTATALVLACATPFPALAALAAVHMRRVDGIALMLLAWASGLAAGYCLLGRSQDVWSIALATAAVASLLGARFALVRSGAASIAAKLAIGYVAAFVAFKLAVLLWSFALGGASDALSPAVIARQFVRNGAILIGLSAFYHALLAIGLPAPRRMAAAA